MRSKFILRLDAIALNNQLLTKTSLAFAALVVSRIYLVSIINTIPDMDSAFYDLAQRVFETSGRTPINLPFGYAALIYGTVKLVGSFALASKLIYVVFSILTGAVLYQLVKEMFDRKIAANAVAIYTLVPNFTFAIAGFSHTVTVAMFFLMLSLRGYWRLLSNTAKSRFLTATLTALAALLATSIRPELSLYFLLFVAAQSILSLHPRNFIHTRRGVEPLILMIALFAVGLAGNYWFNLARSSSAYPTIFTDSEHSYLTYTHTLSLRAGNGADDERAIELGDLTFGAAAENNYSIARAIAKNPKQAILNVVFNLKELLDGLGHQLFMPIFLFLFVGVGLLATDWNKLWREHLFLIACLAPCVAALLLFHVEIRYLNPLALIFSIWIALGLGALHPRIAQPAKLLLLLALALLFAVQANYFSQNPISQHIIS